MQSSPNLSLGLTRGCSDGSGGRREESERERGREGEGAAGGEEQEYGRSSRMRVFGFPSARRSMPREELVTRESAGGVAAHSLDDHSLLRPASISQDSAPASTLAPCFPASKAANPTRPSSPAVILTLFFPTHSLPLQSIHFDPPLARAFFSSYDRKAACHGSLISAQYPLPMTASSHTTT